MKTEQWLIHYQQADREKAKEIAASVVKARQQAGISQRGLARLTGIAQPNIARIERGDVLPSNATLAKLSAELNTQLP